MADFEYFTIHIRMNKSAPSMMFYQEQHDELYLTANGRLSELGAHLDSQSLAQEFLDAYMPRLVKRYGTGLTADIIKCTARCGSSMDKKIAARIEADSSLARKRIQSGVLASNKKP